MDLDTIKQLMKAMEENGTTRISLKEENGFAIELERSPDFHLKPYVQQRPEPIMKEVPQSVPLEGKHEALKEEKTANEGDRAEDITSPMVGTFYASPTPEDPPFISVGDVVKEDTVVCIIEAMKVMNEVKAGKSGKILEVFVDNANPVEFGTKLFRIG